MSTTRPISCRTTFRSLNLFLEVSNVFDTTYVASANNIANTVTAAGLQNPASVLGKHDGIDLRGLAARVRCGYEGGIQMIRALRE